MYRNNTYYWDFNYIFVWLNPRKSVCQRLFLLAEINRIVKSFYVVHERVNVSVQWHVLPKYIWQAIIYLISLFCIIAHFLLNRLQYASTHASSFTGCFICVDCLGVDYAFSDVLIAPLRYRWHFKFYWILELCYISTSWIEFLNCAIFWILELCYISCYKCLIIITMSFKELKMDGTFDFRFCFKSLFLSIWIILPFGDEEKRITVYT